MEKYEMVTHKQGFYKVEEEDNSDKIFYAGFYNTLNKFRCDMLNVNKERVQDIIQGRAEYVSVHKDGKLLLDEHILIEFVEDLHSYLEDVINDSYLEAFETENEAAKFVWNKVMKFIDDFKIYDKDVSDSVCSALELNIKIEEEEEEYQEMNECSQFCITKIEIAYVNVLEISSDFFSIV